jgi:hypothetical protein
MTHRETEHQQHNFEKHGIPQAIGRGNDFGEARAILCSDDVSLKKLSNNDDQPSVHNQLSHDQQGQCGQKSGVDFQVQQERHRHSAQKVTRYEGKHQEREPAKQ